MYSFLYVNHTSVKWNIYLCIYSSHTNIPKGLSHSKKKKNCLVVWKRPILRVPTALRKASQRAGYQQGLWARWAQDGVWTPTLPTLLDLGTPPSLSLGAFLLLSVIWQWEPGLRCRIEGDSPCKAPRSLLQLWDGSRPALVCGGWRRWGEGSSPCRSKASPGPSLALLPLLWPASLTPLHPPRRLPSLSFPPEAGPPLSLEPQEKGGAKPFQTPGRRGWRLTLPGTLSEH